MKTSILVMEKISITTLLILFAIVIIPTIAAAQQGCGFKEGAMASENRYHLEDAGRLADKGNMKEVLKMVENRRIILLDRNMKGKVLEQLPRVVKVRIDGMNQEVWVFRISVISRNTRIPGR